MLPRTKFQKINLEIRLLIFLLKMKTGLSYDCIATFFGVDPTCISRIFYDTLSILAQRTVNYIFWPSREDIQETMPPSFKVHYPNCRVIIDCTEIKCEQPSLVFARNHMYSDYKSGYTVKFLLGITPSGMISFKSECYGGRSSDPFITNDSNFLKLLEPDDEVMADKGFPSIKKSIDVPNAIIVTPPFLHDGHLTEDEIVNTYNIASVRIHVERCIARIKVYNILIKINIDLLPYIDDIVHMCCVLVNLQPPIFKSEENK
ncbi:hypothetical protein WA026_007452 [Henosepilachna vigintioctopunctata]|uniref:DDE Tnp4 domain-containing protein n=1 Tax=Henosepilachna vigintioctopunctata TaxID=420089 RepID=A0AAW1UX90_9CUCU